MPNFGDERRELAFQLSADVTGPRTPPLNRFGIPDLNATNDKTSSGEYYNPPGYIIIGTEIEEKNKQGTVSIDDTKWFPTNTRETLKTETVESDLKARAKWFYAQYTGEGDLKAKFDKMRTAYERTSSYDQGLKIIAHVVAGIAATSKYEADVYAKLMYVGLEQDHSSIVDELLRGKTFERTINLKDVKNDISFRGSNYFLEDDKIQGNDKDKKYENPSFHYDISELPKGTEITFNAKMCTEKPYQRTGELVIWELYNNGKNGTPPFIFNENWQSQSISYTKQEDDTLIRVESYWHDNEDVNTILNLDECSIKVKKSF